MPRSPDARFSPCHPAMAKHTMRMFVERAWALSLVCWGCNHEALIWPDKLEARFGLDRTIGDLVGRFKCTECPSKQIMIYPHQTGGYGGALPDVVKR